MNGTNKSVGKEAKGTTKEADRRRSKKVKVEIKQPISKEGNSGIVIPKGIGIR